MYSMPWCFLIIDLYLFIVYYVQKWKEEKLIILVEKHKAMWQTNQNIVYNEGVLGAYQCAGFLLFI